MATNSMQPPSTVKDAVKKTEPRRSSASTSRRASSTSSTRDHEQSTPGSDGQVLRKRVWKACDRCRMRKTKCDAAIPCKRCKEDGHVCTTARRAKSQYKPVRPGYAEVLENNQAILAATIYKLYAMVRNATPWDLGDPELNDHGQPIVHEIARKLGCVRPDDEVDLPIQSAFPDDMGSISELTRQLGQNPPWDPTHVHDAQEVNAGDDGRGDVVGLLEPDTSSHGQSSKSMPWSGMDTVFYSPWDLAEGGHIESGNLVLNGDASALLPSGASTSLSGPVPDMLEHPWTIQYLQESGLFPHSTVFDQGNLEGDSEAIEPEEHY